MKGRNEMQDFKNCFLCGRIIAITGNNNSADDEVICPSCAEDVRQAAKILDYIKHKEKKNEHN